MDNEVKLCKDCKHYVANRADAKLSPVDCDALGNKEPDYINGGTRHYYNSARALRSDREMCAPSARWFEPKGAA